ncbi:(2Fe-2S) ferredoxin domain-containing protein [candidate division KSB1 bacterium]|nr:(2Fe-2S) ferredoxin domain-containing protein [candidate division KSB1 bacterium]
MKTLEELQQIREKAQQSVFLRQKHARCTIKVALGTCGIAAGARTVMAAILDELGKRNVKDVLVTQSGCMGYCDQEPIVEVSDENGNKVLYGKVDPNSARKIIAEHVMNGQVVDNLVFVNQPSH